MSECVTFTVRIHKNGLEKNESADPGPYYPIRTNSCFFTFSLIDHWSSVLQFKLHLKKKKKRSNRSNVMCDLICTACITTSNLNKRKVNTKGTDTNKPNTKTVWLDRWNLQQTWQWRSRIIRILNKFHFHPPQASLPWPPTEIDGTQFLCICQDLPVAFFIWIWSGWRTFVIHPLLPDYF